MKKAVIEMSVSELTQYLDEHMGESGPQMSLAVSALAGTAMRLLMACKAQHDAIEALYAERIVYDHGFRPSAHKTFLASIQGFRAIQSAEGLSRDATS